MFLNPVQQPALGLSFPSAEAPQTSYTHCPSFILCIFTLPSNANSRSSGESCPSAEQVLTETFVHHWGIYSCCTLQEIKREQTYDSASLLCRQWFASHSLQSRMPPTKTWLSCLLITLFTCPMTGQVWFSSPPSSFAAQVWVPKYCCMASSLSCNPVLQWKWSLSRCLKGADALFPQTLTACVTVQETTICEPRLVRIPQ